MQRVLEGIHDARVRNSSAAGGSRLRPRRTQDSRAGAGLQNTQTYIATGLSPTAKPSISAIVLDREALWCRTLANVWPGPRRPALAMANKRVGAHGRAGGFWCFNT